MPAPTMKPDPEATGPKSTAEYEALRRARIDAARRAPKKAAR